MTVEIAFIFTYGEKCPVAVPIIRDCSQTFLRKCFHYENGLTSSEILFWKFSRRIFQQKKQQQQQQLCVIFIPSRNCTILLAIWNILILSRTLVGIIYALYLSSILFNSVYTVRVRLILTGMWILELLMKMIYFTTECSFVHHAGSTW